MILEDSAAEEFRKITSAEEFRKEYNRLHACCPKCNSNACTTTLIGYILDMSSPDEYEDKNNCICNNCGDIHIVHDRVPKIEPQPL